MDSDAAKTSESAGQAQPGNAIVQTVTNVVPASGMRAWGQRMVLKWLAGGVGHPYVKQIRDNLDEQEGRSKVNMMLAEEVGRQAIQDPRIVEQYKARILGDLWRKQENLDAVGQKTEQIIEESPVAEQEPPPDREPDADFLGAFTREAENASSDELRERLARLLAGEIRHPGSVGRATVRLVADLDQDTLAAFQNLMGRRLRDVIVKGADWDEGIMFAQGMRLESAGLVHASNAFMANQIKADPDGNAFVMGEHLGLAMAVDPGFAQQQPVWLLTKAGLEISKLLPRLPDERATLREVFDRLAKDQVRTAHIGAVVNTPNGIMVVHQELLYQRPPVPLQPGASIAP